MQNQPQAQKPVNTTTPVPPLTPAPVLPLVPAPVPPPAPAVDPSSASVSRIVFYCKDCDKLVNGMKIGRKYVYKCPVCGTKNVAFGTEKSIKSYYHVE